MGRAPCCEKVGMKKGRWTAEEDKILTDYIHQHGEGSWRSLPKNAGLLRCGKSCRLRWINYLRADVKRGNITAEEEELIVKLHSLIGNRWSVIAGHLPGRTDNEIKNYWNSHLRRKIYCFMRSLNESLPPIDMASVNLATTSKRIGNNKGTKNKPTNNEEDKNISLCQNSYESMPKRNTTTSQGYCSTEEAEEISMMDAYYEMEDNYSTSTTVSSFMNGPYQWQDDEIMKLSDMFENGVLVNQVGNVTLKKEANGNDCLKMNDEIMGITQGNSVMDYQWSDWDFAASVLPHNSQWDFCEDEQMVTIGGIDGFHQ